MPRLKFLPPLYFIAMFTFAEFFYEAATMLFRRADDDIFRHAAVAAFVTPRYAAISCCWRAFAADVFAIDFL